MKNIWRKQHEDLKDSDTSETSPDDRSIPYIRPDGIDHAVHAFGAQDEWCQNASEEAIEEQSKLLHTKYFERFARLDYHDTDYSTSQLRCLTLHRSCDLLNNFVLVLRPGTQRLGDILESVTLEIGGQQIDTLCCEDIETQINAVNWTHGKQIEHIGDKAYVPLPLAMTHKGDYIALYLLDWHEVRVLLCFKQKDVDFSLHASQVFLPKAVRRSASLLEHVTYQTQYTGKEVIDTATETMRLRLNLNHPTSCIFFWGVDKRLLASVELLLNGHSVLHTDMESLEYQHRRKANPDPPVTYVYLSHLPYFTRDLASMNFSVIDNAVLVLHAREKIPAGTSIFLCAINSQVCRTMSGMSGLAFSK